MCLAITSSTGLELALALQARSSVPPVAAASERAVWLVAVAWERAVWLAAVAEKLVL